MDWQSLLTQIKLRHEALIAIEDEIGSSYSDRAVRNEALFNTVTEAIDGQVKRITAEKDNIIQECREFITRTINMRKAMGERLSIDASSVERIDIQKPYLQTLQRLKQEHRSVEAAYNERLVTVKKLHDTLAIYTPHLEESFLNISIPDPSKQVVDVTAAYVSAVTAELSRCTEEYRTRLEQCQRTANEIVNLWAQLGPEASNSSMSSSISSISLHHFDPQSDFDRLILDNHNNAPEKIGLKQDVLNRLASKRDELLDEKQKRQAKINERRQSIEPMWQKLGKERKECEAFLRRNRGFSEKVINAYEKELASLMELKRQNMHIFVDAARKTLQNLWDELFYSEEQMAEFTPAFTDIFTDASLASHEYEVKRLESLVNARQTVLSLVKKHMELVSEKQHLEESSKDPSRLTQRGAQAAGRLLQEEKVRKKLSKELPKIEQELTSVLQAWEDENGEDFFVYGERYLDVLERLSRIEKAPASRRIERSTPASPAKVPQTSRAPSRAPPSRPPSVARSVPPANRTEPRLITTSTLTNPQTPGKARRPLGTMSSQAASVRSVPESPSPSKPISLEHAHLKMRPPAIPKPTGTTSPMGRSQSHKSHNVFALPVPPLLQPPSPTRSTVSNSSTSSMMAGFRSMPNMNYPRRDFSNGSLEDPSATSQTSENWETYDEGSEPEEEYDTPRAMGARKIGFEGLISSNSMASHNLYSPSRNRRSGSMNSTMSGKARVYLQQQSQRGQELIAELMEEVQEADDEWGDEGF